MCSLLPTWCFLLASCFEAFELFRYWHLADIPSCAAHVRFRGSAFSEIRFRGRYWGQSGHDVLRRSQSGHGQHRFGVITTLSMMLCEDGHGALFPDNYFSLITLNHNAQAHSNCEHLEGWMSRGPGKFQRLLWQILLDHGRPITVAEICGRAQVGDSRERRVRRALQGMVNHGVAVATGSCGKGHPRHYSIDPLIARTTAPARRARRAPPL
jgi:hypothetical protein